MSEPAQSAEASSREGGERRAGVDGASGGSGDGVGTWLYCGHVVALAGIAVSNVVLGLLLLVSPWLGRWRRLRERMLQPALVAIGAYVVVLALSVVFSYDPTTSVEELSEIFTLLVFVLGLVVLVDERRVRMAIGAVVVLATVEAVVGLIQYGAAGGIDLGGRIDGTLSHYMTFSGILMIADLVLIAHLASARRLGRRWLALVPINLALLASLTRTAWVGLAAGVLVILLLARRRLLVGAVTAAILVLFLVSDGPVLDRATSIVDPADPTNYDRLCMVEAGLEMVVDRPSLGLGPGMASELYPIYRHPTALRQEVPHLHNALLQLAAERGVAAPLAYLALMAVVIARAWRLYRDEGGVDGRRADLLVATVAVVVGFTVAGLFENNWADTEVQRLLLVMAAVPFCLTAARDEG